MMTTGIRRAAFGAALALFSLSALGAEITLFEGENFQGRRMVIRGDTQNLDNSGFNDQASSIVVRDGVWEACIDAFFRGGCIQLRPGEYRQLDDRFSRNISSLRVIGDSPAVGSYDAPPGYNPPAYNPGSVQGYNPPGYNAPGNPPGYSAPGSPPAYNAPGPYARNDNDRPGYRRDDGRARAVLFERPGFRGRAFPISGEVVNNLASTGFNDRASSLRVERGYWIFCSDANFAGDCRTFGPGEYPELPDELNRSISSGRRIHDQYPYREPAEWDSQ